jgi:UDP-N-acetylglucosamine:LPS N-acetylglucosamine transferase
MNPKIGIISSCGGHLTEARRLQNIYGKYDYFYVVNDRITLPPEMEGRTHFIRHSERDWLFFVNLWEAWHILRREHPALLLSTGAGPAVPFALVARLFKIPFIFVEISAQVTEPSLTGRILYLLADRFYYQWKPLGKHFPKAVYGGLLV